MAPVRASVRLREKGGRGEFIVLGKFLLGNQIFHTTEFHRFRCVLTIFVQKKYNETALSLHSTTIRCRTKSVFILKTVLFQKNWTISGRLPYGEIWSPIFDFSTVTLISSLNNNNYVHSVRFYVLCSIAQEIKRFFESITRRRFSLTNLQLLLKDRISVHFLCVKNHLTSMRFRNGNKWIPY